MESSDSWLCAVSSAAAAVAAVIVVARPETALEAQASTLRLQRKLWKVRCSMNKKYVCKICGWVYDPAEHDNVAFEDLPADWHCPVCGVGKDDFEPAYN